MEQGNENAIGGPPAASAVHVAAPRPCCAACCARGADDE